MGMNAEIEFEGFVRRYQDMVYTTAARLLGGSTEAEDVAQETFLRAFERFEALRESPTAGGWLKTVAANLALNHVQRHQRRHVELDETLPLAEPAPRESAGLEAALDRLPEHQRVPLVLFHFHDLSYEDIAAKLGVPLSKVKSDIHRGRQALKHELGE